MENLIANIKIFVLNGLNTPIRSWRLAVNKKKKKITHLSAVQKIHFQFSDIIQLKTKVWQNFAMQTSINNKEEELS